MKQRYHLFVSGKVQKVGFRLRTKIRAKRYNLKGWIRNLKDGRVEIVVEGEEKNLKKLLNWIRSNPVFTQIKEIEIKKEEPKDEFNNFEIKH